MSINPESEPPITDAPLAAPVMMGAPQGAPADPSMVQPQMMQQPMMQQPGMMQQPMMQQPGMMQQPMMQQPGMMQ